MTTHISSAGTSTDDEHNTDVALLRHMLDTCRDEIAQLKAQIHNGRTIQVQLGENGQMPTRAHDGDAGYDLYVSQRTRVGAAEFVDVPCDLALALPDNTWGLVIGRSSALRTLGLMVNQGVIDAGYRGPMFAGCFNLRPLEHWLEAGQRVAQIIPIPLTAATLKLQRVAQLRPGDRGTNGFGSTGH